MVGHSKQCVKPRIDRNSPQDLLPRIPISPSSPIECSVYGYTENLRPAASHNCPGPHHGTSLTSFKTPIREIVNIYRLAFIILQFNAHLVPLIYIPSDGHVRFSASGALGRPFSVLALPDNNNRLSKHKYATSIISRQSHVERQNRKIKIMLALSIALLLALPCSFSRSYS